MYQVKFVELCRHLKFYIYITLIVTSVLNVEFLLFEFFQFMQLFSYQLQQPR